MSAQERSPSVDLDGFFTPEKFLRLVDSKFEALSDGGQRTWLTLLSVKGKDASPAVETASMAVAPKPSRTPAPALNTFFLSFLATDDGLPQGTYQMTGSGGSFPLFIVPAGNFLYSATICRLISRGPALGRR